MPKFRINATRDREFRSSVDPIHVIANLLFREPPLM